VGGTLFLSEPVDMAASALPPELPVQFDESTPDRLLERAVIFRRLRTNIGLPDHFFQLEGQ